MIWIASPERDTRNAALEKRPWYTANEIASDNWNRPYTREAAAFSVKTLHDYKFWPLVGRVDNIFGDRNPGLLLRGDGELPELNQ